SPGVRDRKWRSAPFRPTRPGTSSSRHWTRVTPRTGRWRSPGCGTVTTRRNWSPHGGSTTDTSSVLAQRRDGERAIRVTMTGTVELTDHDASIYQHTVNPPGILEYVQ